MPIIPALGRLRQVGGEFMASLGCIARPCLNKTKQNKKEFRVGYGSFRALLDIQVCQVGRER
jgi:hypothetical protein